MTFRNDVSYAIDRGGLPGVFFPTTAFTFRDKARQGGCLKIQKVAFSGFREEGLGEFLKYGEHKNKDFGNILKYVASLPQPQLVPNSAISLLTLRTHLNRPVELG